MDTAGFSITRLYGCIDYELTHNNIYIVICSCILLMSNVIQAAVLAFWRSFIILYTSTLTCSISNYFAL